MSVIRGSNVVLYFLVDGQYKPLCCARDVEFTTNSELAETSTDDTGIYRTYKGLRHTWTVSCSGLCSFDRNAAIATMRELQRGFTPVYISFTATDENDLVETYSGFILIETIGTNASYNDLYKYNLSGRGTGAYEITENPIDPDEINGKIMVYPYDGTGAETDGITLPAIPELTDKEILWATRDGIYFRKVETAPNSKQFILDGSDSTIITFSESDPPIQAGEMIDIVYQNQL